MSCSICGAPSSGGQYCIGCGEPLGAPIPAGAHAMVGTRERTQPAPGAWLALQEIRLLACPKCGAPNSAARWRCARCGQAFDEHDRSDALLHDASAESVVAVPTESSRWLMLITVAAGVAVVAVAVMMMTARGIGPFGGEGEGSPTLTEAIPIAVERVEASRQAADGAATAISDGDASTAWQVAGNAVDQWVELDFGRPVQIDHLLVWNGDQRSNGAFYAANRVSGMVIEFPDTGKLYAVEQLPDRQENVRVTMKDRPPVTDKIRVHITSVKEGTTSVTALSEIQALARRAPASQ